MSPAWIPHIGKFLHQCKYCGEEYHGRENKQYCSSACRARLNNEKARKRTQAMKQYSAAALNNIRILSEMLGAQDSASTTVNKLESLGFDVSAPSRRINLPTGQEGLGYGIYLVFPAKEDDDIFITKTKEK